MARATFLFASALGLVACAEPRAPAPARRAPPTISPAPPLPETAFTGPEGTPPRTDRFAPRAIGPRGEDVAPLQRGSGAKVDLDVKNADLHDVFRLLADVGRVNLVVADDVAGTITLRLRQVPWDQALDVVARAKGLEVAKDGAILLVRRAR